MQAYGSIAMIRFVLTRARFKMILTLFVIVGLCSRSFEVAIFSFTHLFFLFVYCDLISRQGATVDNKLTSSTK
jgi:hypothetical protein